MSALPLPRSTPDRAPPRMERRANPFDRAAPEGILSRRAARDPDLTAMDVRLMVWREEWGDLHPGTYPTRSQAAAELHVSADTIRRSERRLESRGYLSRRPAAPAGRPPGLMDCDPVPPRPGLASAPCEEVQGDLFREGPRQICQDIAANLPGFPGKFAGISPQICPAPPPDPPVLYESSKNTTDVRASSSFDLSIVEELSRRAYREIPGATPGKIAEALSAVGPEEFAAILDSAGKRNRSRDKRSVEGWGYVVNAVGRIQAKHAAAGRIAVPDRQAVPETEEEAAPGRAGPPMPSAPELAERERDGRIRAAWDALPEIDRETIRVAVKAENPGLHRWPSLLEPLYLAELDRRTAAPPVNNPAAGSHANVPPPPVEEHPVPAMSSYREHSSTASGIAEPRVAHPAPGESNPVPAPSAGASAHRTHAPRPPAGGRVAPPIGSGVAGDPPSPGPHRPGAHRGRARGPVAAGDVLAGLAARAGVESDDRAGARQRDSGDPPEIRRRE